MKKVIALIAAALFIIRFLFLQCFAVSVAPAYVAGEEIAEIITILLSAGHSQSELDGLGTTELQSLLADDLNSGKINSKTIITDPVTQIRMTVLDYCLQFKNSDVGQATNGVQKIVGSAINDFVTDIVNGPEVLLTPTLTLDMQGHGALLEYYGKSLYGEYIVLRPFDNPAEHNGNWGTFTIYYEGGGKFTTSYDENIKFYGDVRYLDGTQAPTADEYEYQLGEADGTKVTVDMLNPDGTVTIDGVTYYPSDYLDPDKLTDAGLDALIAALLEALANTYVKSDDKPLVDTDDITVEVAEEFQDYAVPVGIANIFPFCIPWDIVRGFQLLNRPAVTPKFEIPFNIPKFGLFPGIEKSITLDFSEYDSYIQIFRWFQIIGFAFLLCKLSLTRVKGAGA